MLSAKPKFAIVLPTILTVPSWSSSASAIILSKNMLKRVGAEQTSLAHSHCGSKPFSYVVVLVDSTGRLVEALYGSDQVVIDVKEPHGCPQSCMPISVECLLEVHEDMVKALLVLQVFLTEYSEIENVENLLSCAPSCSEACLFFFGDLLSLWLQST